MLLFDWSNEKNDWLKANRGVSFEQVIILFERDEVIDIVKHPNQKSYPEQMIAVVRIDDHVVWYRSLETETKYFSKR